MSKRSYVGVADKNKKYRQRLVLEGRCPRCGKPAEPYYYCKKHRLYQAVNRSLRTLLKHGYIFQMSDGGYIANQSNYGKTEMREQKVKENDARKLPRFKGRPMNEKFYMEIIPTILKEAQHGMTEKQIEQAILLRKRTACTF